MEMCYQSQYFNFKLIFAINYIKYLTKIINIFIINHSYFHSNHVINVHIQFSSLGNTFCVDIYKTRMYI